jgi:hypothetical protein
MKLLLACVVVVVSLVGCKKKPVEPPGAGSAQPPEPVAAGSGSAAGSAAGSGVASAPTQPPQPAAAAPTLSADVLPKDEATPKTRVVSGDGFRYQIPQDSSPTTIDGAAAYTATVSGFGSDAKLTFWATSEPFKGSLLELVAREAKAAGVKGEPDAGWVMVQVAGDIKQNYAKRMTLTLPDRMELRTMVVHDGKAYIHHCATPNVSNAWANVGSDCTARATTFHIAPKPPIGEAHANAAPAAAAPETPNVAFMASKLEGTARAKASVNPWLEDNAAPFLKPCLKDAASGTTFKVTFELGKDGKASTSSVESGTDAFKPADAAISSCIAKAIEPLKIDGAADATVKVTALFVIK